MRQYWVIGGEYQSTAFEKIAKGEEEVRLGPFVKYDEALKEWQRMAWETVDNAMCHFHIEQEDIGDDTKPTFWVVGGTFVDTSFQNFADAPDRFGPFETYEVAEKKWQEMAWQTVDDATAMYRIETLRPEVAQQEEPKEKLAYRFITGPDDDKFCKRISDALNDGYTLYGQPTMTTLGDKLMVGQAVVLGDKA